ncbi:MAG: NAD kinase, partial [Bacteroidota bacterium]|nr:NAD kinase [Bacteroidota bacterium]
VGKSAGINFIINSEGADFLEKTGLSEELLTYSSPQDLHNNLPQMLISMGGDGTLLETLYYVKKTKTPVLGINLGRLGFLTHATDSQIIKVVDCIKSGKYKIEERSVLKINNEHHLFEANSFALNDFTIHKRDTGSMIIVDTYLNGEYFTNYWADGVIVATPTGSTAYSLSCGGPIIFPETNSLVITPVAPHNLSMRPIIVPDSSVISFRVRGRGESHMVSLDSRFTVVEYNHEIGVQIADFKFQLVRLGNFSFIETLREKLKWGLDYRNL